MSATGYKIADGTDLLTTFQSVLSTTGNTFSSPSNVFYGDGSNLTGLTGPANMVTTDTAQTMSALKTFSGTTGGIQLTNCCIAGRTDNFGFTGSAGLATYPIGYTINHISPPTALPAVNTLTYYTGLPFVDAGVWLVDGGIVIMQGTAQWNFTQYIGLRYQAIGGSINPSAYAAVYYFTTPASNLSYNFPSAIFVATNTNRTSQVQPYFSMSYSATGGTYTHAIQMTKIA